MFVLCILHPNALAVSIVTMEVEEDAVLLRRFTPFLREERGRVKLDEDQECRRCALHAVLAFYFHPMLDELPRWLTKVEWLDGIVTLRQLCGGAGVSTLCDSHIDEFQEVSKEHVPAFYVEGADWARIRTASDRVAFECIDISWEFKASQGFTRFPQAWFRQSWALLEPAPQQMAPKGDDPQHQADIVL